MNKIVSGLFAVMLAVTLMLSFGIQPVKAGGTVYIRADGSVDPPSAPIDRDGDIYTFSDNINDEIVVERDNIIINGSGYTVSGPGTGWGFNLTNINNVMIKNLTIARAL